MMEKVVEKEPVSPPPLTAGAGAAAAAELSHELEPGVAYIKTEYVIPHSTTDHTPTGRDEGNKTADSLASEPPPSKKRRRGQNKHRPRAARISFSEMLCPSLHDLQAPGVSEATCSFKEKCRYTHDIADFMSKKPPDIGEQCFVFEKYGKCPYGAACRYAGNHLTPEFVNIVREGVYDPQRGRETCNIVPRHLQEALRKKKVVFERSERYLEKLRGTGDVKVRDGDSKGQGGGMEEKEEEGGVKMEGVIESSAVVKEGACTVKGVVREGGGVLCEMEVEGSRDMKTPSGAVTDEGEIRLRPSEKKKVDFRDKLFLAPLTTTGNLPFRRICKEFGADITCGEMAMCTNLLQGQQSEWALLKRHQSEDLFGVQICGSHADTMTRCAELINDHTSVDFVDINTGCPIDLVFKKGAGSALMGRHTRFEGIVRGMVEVLDCPLTVKMRTGIYKKNWNAHKLVPKLREWGVSLATVHGRSREQRYTKLADWDYIRSCVEAADPMPLFGNGDVLSYEDYNSFREVSGVAGCMIARGALIKPWVFTEIKEQRHWDISSSERLEILRRYSNYGLEHWGSDAQGVENTRKFLLEWLSFLYRYIPVGLLEHPPQRINQRPPYYRGRDDLETLMASNNCQDWIKISEMVLGPAPDSFSFLPKHRANAYN